MGKLRNSMQSFPTPLNGFDLHLAPDVLTRQALKPSANSASTLKRIKNPTVQGLATTHLPS